MGEHSLFDSVAGLGELRNNNDASCSYEGENNVLIQQTSNWLLSVRKTGYHSFKHVSPLGSAAFLSDFDRVINSKFTFKTSEEALRPESMTKETNYSALRAAAIPKHFFLQIF